MSITRRMNELSCLYNGITHTDENEHTETVGTFSNMGTFLKQNIEWKKTEKKNAHWLCL